MKACVLKAPGRIETNPLEYTDVAMPEPGAGEVRIRVLCCGVCRTDLHVIEGELTPRKSPVIPGHQVVGLVEKLGAGATKWKIGDRVGVAWLYSADGTCRFCMSERENLCDAPEFTGYTRDGGYAEYVVASQDFIYAIPEEFTALEAAPLLCAGIIGFRSLKLAGLPKGGRIGFYGFGAAASLAIQVALSWGAEVFASTRDERHRKLALELGAKWAGGTLEAPPKKLDAAIVFAPAGEIVPAALAALDKGGVLVLGGIHMSPIPSFSYDILYQERVIRSVANNTRDDGREFLRAAASIPIKARTEIFPLSDANRALNSLKNDAIRGEAVLHVADEPAR
jgi:alcohol dehydrogenase, propanol-preferring